MPIDGEVDDVAALLAEARTHYRQARTRADQVVVGFTLGAQLDSLARDLDRFDGDLAGARQLDNRARRLLNQASAERRRRGARTTSAAAAMIISRPPSV